MLLHVTIMFPIDIQRLICAVLISSKISMFKNKIQLNLNVASTSILSYIQR